MKLSGHVVASSVIAVTIFLVSRNLILALSSFLAGVFIDLDHLWDYFRSEGLKFDLKDFFYKCDNFQLKKFYLFFHSFELLPVLGIFTYLAPSLKLWSVGDNNHNHLLIGTLIGFSQHLFLDQVFNRAELLGYFFFYRWRKGFSGESIFSKEFFPKSTI